MCHRHRARLIDQDSAQQEGIAALNLKMKYKRGKKVSLSHTYIANIALEELPRCFINAITFDRATRIIVVVIIVAGCCTIITGTRVVVIIVCVAIWFVYQVQSLAEFHECRLQFYIRRAQVVRQRVMRIVVLIVRYLVITIYVVIDAATHETRFVHRLPVVVVGLAHMVAARLAIRFILGQHQRFHYKRRRMKMSDWIARHGRLERDVIHFEFGCLTREILLPLRLPPANCHR